MARPTKLTEARAEEIVEKIRNGNFAVVSAVSCGITEQTYYNWLNRGQAELAAGESTIYAEFFESVKEAEAEAEVTTLREMNRDDKWQRRAWWLERRFPKRWGQKAALEVSGPDGGPVQTADVSREAIEHFLDERKDAIAAAQAALASAEEETLGRE